MKKVLTILIPFVFIGCEDEAEKAADCTSFMGQMEAATDKFENEPTKANCNAVLKAAQAVYDCMPAGFEKDKMKEDLDALKCPIEITYNIHESLPSDWVTEFYVIMDNLLKIIPSYQTNFDHINIYGWNSNVEDPYSGIDGGAYVGGSSEDPILVLEIYEMEFEWNSLHRYSVIAHEYFHIYQLSINQPMNLPNGDYDPNGFSIKWLLEGTAASFESLYIQNYYDYNYFMNAQNNINEMVHTNPSIFESYESNNIEINYGSSVFITLVLAKELINLGYSEEVAFRMIYEDFMLTEVKNSNWQNHFVDVFGISVDDFYQSLQSYPLDINYVLPSESLSIEDIFN